MKIIPVLIAGVFASAGPASAQYLQPYNGGFGNYGTGSNPSSVYHQGYMAPSGTYVQPHYQTAPNSTQYDNYGTRGNFNPHTGTYGTRSPRW